MSWWGRITGKDKGLARPNQQVSNLGQLRDPNIVSAYGLYADLPDGTLLVEVQPNVFMAVTEARPSDLERGEPAFFHPATGTRIVARNNGDLDIITGEDGTTGSVNVRGAKVNVVATESVSVEAPTTTVTGDLVVTGDLTVGGKDFLTHTHTQANDSGGNVEQPTGPVA